MKKLRIKEIATYEKSTSQQMFLNRDLNLEVSNFKAHVLRYCKTQNSGLRPKEEKPRNPINQPSRCNTQEGLLSVA